MTVDGHRSSGPLPPTPQDFDYAEDYAEDYPEDYAESEDVVIPGPAYPTGNGQYADPDGDLVPDESPIQLRRELRRRMSSPVPPAAYRPDAGPAPSSGQSTVPGQPPTPGQLGPPGQPGGAGASGQPASVGHPIGLGQPRPADQPTGRGPAQPGLAVPAAQGGPAAVRPTSGGGRHARRDGQPRRPRLDYVPRHAIRTPGPGSVSPTEVTEVFSRVRQDPTERPMPARPESEPVQGAQGVQPLGGPPVATAAPRTEEPKPAEPPPSGKRERVVLSQRRGTTRPVRTVVDVQELTQVGEVLSTSLIRSQLALALRVGGIALITLGSLPAMFVIFPVLGRFELFGLRLPWLLLGVLAYPFLVALGWMYSRSAERLEQVFADHIQS